VIVSNEDHGSAPPDATLFDVDQNGLQTDSVDRRLDHLPWRQHAGGRPSARPGPDQRQRYALVPGAVTGAAAAPSQLTMAQKFVVSRFTPPFQISNPMKMLLSHQVG
jgi:hypothetical protein